MDHTLIDGSQVSLEADADLSLAPTSFARWKVGGKHFEFGSGRRDFADGFARGLGLKDYEIDLSFAGGRLRGGSDVILDETTRWSAARSWAVWEGPWHSFFTQRIDVSVRDLIGVVARFDVTEADEGVSISPHSNSIVPAAGSGVPCLYKGVSGIGLMSIWRRGGSGTPVLPTWGGRPVRGGDLYRGSSTQLSDGGVQHSLVLVGASAVISLDVALDADEETAVDCMSTIVPRWDR